MKFETITKKCTRCDIEKDIDEFYNMWSGVHGKAGECKKCNVLRSRKWAIENKRKIKHLQLLRDYNMTIDEYEEMLESQEHKCSICLKHKDDCKRGLYVDHCHKTGSVRGLLCSRCNLAIGMFDDDSNLLKASANYIETFKN